MIKAIEITYDSLDAPMRSDVSTFMSANHPAGKLAITSFSYNNDTKLSVVAVTGDNIQTYTDAIVAHIEETYAIKPDTYAEVNLVKSLCTLPETMAALKSPETFYAEDAKGDINLIPGVFARAISWVKGLFGF